MFSFTYGVDFAVDHDALAAADYDTVTVEVLADDTTTASLLAASLVGHLGIPVATRLLTSAPFPS